MAYFWGRGSVFRTQPTRFNLFAVPGVSSAVRYVKLGPVGEGHLNSGIDILDGLVRVHGCSFFRVRQPNIYGSNVSVPLRNLYQIPVEVGDDSLGCKDACLFDRLSDVATIRMVPLVGERGKKETSYA